MTQPLGGALAVTVVLAALVPLGCSRLAAAQELQVLRGQVVEDHTGAAATGAVVRVWRPAGPLLAETETDRSGRFVTRSLPAGEYALEIEKPGHVPAVGRISIGSAAIGVDDEGPTIRLVRTGVIAGRLMDARGGTIMAIERVPDGMVPRTFVGRQNVRGEFRLFGLPPGRYVVGMLNPTTGAGGHRGLVLYPGGGSPYEFAISGGEEHTGIEMVLPPADTFELRGQVLAEGVADPFRPRVVLVPAEHPSVQVSIATTDEEGRFAIERVLPGEYELFASRGLLNGTVDPRFFGRARLSVGWGDIDGLAIATGPGRTADLTLEFRGPPDLRAACGSGLPLTLLPVERFTPEAEVSLPTAQDGVVRVERLAPGRYQLRAEASDGGSCHAALGGVLDLTDGQPARDAIVRRTIVAGAPGTIQGHVEHASDSTGSTVVLTDVTPARDAPIRFAFADAAARFTFEGLPPGQYHLAAHATRGVTGRWAPEAGRAVPVINVEPGDVLAVDLRVAGT